jgi:hypothetical protein
MRNALTMLLAAAAIAAAVTPAAADRRRGWHHSNIGAISRNVITPYYVGYYPGHYSYYKPDPVYVRPYVADPDYACWVWPAYGYRFKVC